MRSKPERIIDEVFATLAPDVDRYIGRRNTERNVAAPSVCAIPTGAPEIVMANLIGEQEFTREDGTKYRARRLLIRNFVIMWECHGAPHFADAESLYEHVIRTMRNTTHYSSSFSGERWIDQQDGADSYYRHGSVIEFQSIVQIPIMSIPGGLATAATIVTTSNLENP